MAGTPVRNLVLMRKGEKSIRVGTEWENEWDDGTRSYTLSPSFEAREYNGKQVEMPLLEALAIVAKGEGRLRFFDTGKRKADPEDDFGA